MSISAQDKELLKRLALAEARSEGVVGMALVIRSVLNRREAIRAGANFNTRSTNIRDIIYAPNQYQPVGDSRNSIDQSFSTTQLSNAEKAFQLAKNPAELQRSVQSDGVSATNARGLVLSNGFDSLGGQGRPDAITYRGHTFTDNINNFGVTGDSIYAGGPDSSDSSTSDSSTSDSSTSSTEKTADVSDPIQVPDLSFNNEFGELSNEELEHKIETIEERLNELRKKSGYNFTEEEKKEWGELAAKQKALKDALGANEMQELASAEGCVTRDIPKGVTFADTPACEKFFNSVAFRDALTKIQEVQPLPDPCGTSEMSKINTQLQKFFTTLKGIKKYANVYVNGSINKIQNITALIRSTSEIIGAVLKTLTNRLRDYLLDKIRRGIEDLIDMLLPTVVKAIKNTIIQTIIDNIFCAFKDIISNLANLVGDFLFELVGKIVNVPFCAAQQFTNALVNNIAATVDKAIGPVLDQLNDVLSGVTEIVGDVFQAIDYILGFEAFLCAKPNCPEIKKFKASPWGGPSQSEIDDFAGFLAKIPTEEDLIEGATDFIDGIEIFGEPLGNSAGTIPSSITKCDVSAFKCGPPSIEIFGGGGVGAAAEVVVDDIGRTIGVDLTNGGSGYTRPPFVSFVDSCEDTFTSGYAVISETGGSGTGGSGTSGVSGGQVTDIILTTRPVVPPRDGRTEFDPPSDTGQPGGNDYVVCLEGFRILDIGVGYTVNDSITITPDIPGLEASVRMTEFGQIISIQIGTNVCGLPGYPDIEINSPTGEGAIIEPILSFTRVSDFNETTADDIQLVLDGPIDTLRGRNVLVEKGFTRKDIVRVVDCVS